MPLRPCPNCEQMISDRAKVCPKCQAPVPESSVPVLQKNLVQCDECGTEVDAQFTTCPNCGAPMPHDASDKPQTADNDHSQASPKPQIQHQITSSTSVPSPQSAQTQLTSDVSSQASILNVHNKINILEAYLNLWKNFNVFNARTSKRNFWLAYIFTWIVTIAWVIFSFILGIINTPKYVSNNIATISESVPEFMSITGTVISALHSFLLISLLFRRWNDIEHSGLSEQQIISNGKVVVLIVFALEALVNAISNIAGDNVTVLSILFMFIFGIASFVIFLIIGLKPSAQTTANQSLPYV